MLSDAGDEYKNYITHEIIRSEMYGDSEWAWPSSFVIPFQNAERDARLSPANTTAAAGVPASRSLSRTALTFAFLFAPLLVAGIAVLGPSPPPKHAMDDGLGVVLA